MLALTVDFTPAQVEPGKLGGYYTRAREVSVRLYASGAREVRGRLYTSGGNLVGDYDQLEKLIYSSSIAGYFRMVEIFVFFVL